METGYPNFDACFKLRELGFPQLRKFQSMYYVRPDMLICIDDLSSLKSVGLTDFENIFNTLVFRPRIGDLWAVMEEYVQEIVKMGDGTYFAYSTVEEDPDYIRETGRVDKFMRAPGANPREALMELYIKVAGKHPLRPLAPEGLETSENRQEAIIDPTLP